MTSPADDDPFAPFAPESHAEPSNPTRETLDTPLDVDAAPAFTSPQETPVDVPADVTLPDFETSDLETPEPTMSVPTTTPISRPDAGGLELLIPKSGPALPCTCSCGCRKPVRIPTTNVTPALAAALRCASCALTCEGALTESALAQFSAKDTRELVNERELERWRESVPAKFRNATTTHPTAVDRLKRMKIGKPVGLYIYGGVGGGKTWIGYGFLNEIVKQQILRPSQILHGRETELLGSVAFATFQDREAARAELLDPRRQLVMIDDVGWAKFPRIEDQHALWHEFMDNVWANNRHIVLTTNHDTAALKEWIGPAAYDRLLALCGSTRVTVNDINMRQQLSDEAENAWRDSTIVSSTGEIVGEQEDIFH